MRVNEIVRLTVERAGSISIPNSAIVLAGVFGYLTVGHVTGDYSTPLDDVVSLANGTLGTP